MDEKKLFLLDAYALIFRAYYAFISRPITNSKGLNTSAIFGFLNSLDEILRKEKPTHIAVAFDPPSPTFRKKMYKEYKANRDATPEDIKKSVPLIKQILDGFNIPVLEVEGYEADDVIGTIAKKAEKEGYETYMMTSDKDFGQLVSDKIFIYKPRRSGNDADILKPTDINEKYQIENPLQVIDILALWGDSSDNVPGVPGIGEKNAKILISKYKSVENIYNYIDELKGKQKENLINSKEQVKLSKDLVTIRTDVPLEVNLDNLKISNINKEKLKPIFDELEFRTISKRILQDDIDKPVESASQGTLFDVPSESETNSNLKTIDDFKKNYTLIENEIELKRFIDNLQKINCFCFDTETTGLNILNSKLVGISICYRTNEAYYISVSNDEKQAEKILRILKPIFENPNIKKVGQNIKYDIQILDNHHIEVKGELFDTMIAHYLLQPELRHNMDYLAEIYLSYKTISIESLIGKKGKDQLNMQDIPASKIKDYACEDADITWQLFEKLKEEIFQNNLNNLTYKIEMPLIYVLAKMEKSGFKINTTDLNNYALVLNNEIDELEKKIYEIAGIHFNIASPKQLGEVLFEKLKIKEGAKRTKTKQYSTSEDVLNQLADKHPIVKLVLEFRMLKKLLSTYVEALPKLIDKNTGKVHTSFEQAWVATGRLSSKNPNLQNIPIRDQKGREIRKAFIASGDDYTLISADYSQIELRLMAHMSSDEVMIDAFNNNSDIHAATASKIYNVSIDNVTKEMRAKAKTANFGIIYGISSFGLSQRLSIGRSEAKELIDGYFSTYKKVKQYMDDSIRKAKKLGYVETIMGRKRYLRDINSANAMVRGMAERNAINAPIQGSAADLIKLAMVNIQKILEKSFKTKMILQVHDELIFDVYNPELENIKNIIRNEMQNVYKLTVPLIVDIGIGKNWLEAH